MIPLAKTTFSLGLALATALVGLATPTGLAGRAEHREPITPPPTASVLATWPVSPADVLHGFEPTTTYGPGHRGVDLAAEGGERVRAALPGQVVVAGAVVGRPVVVVAHAGGLRTTYLPVTPEVEVGDRVAQGEVIGVVTGPVHCDVDCLHWGARVGEQYVDPLSLLGRGPIRLLPLAGP